MLKKMSRLSSFTVPPLVTVPPKMIRGPLRYRAGYVGNWAVTWETMPRLPLTSSSSALVSVETGLAPSPRLTCAHFTSDLFGSRSSRPKNYARSNVSEEITGRQLLAEEAKVHSGLNYTND